MPYIGQRLFYRLTSTRTCAAQVAKIISGDIVDIQVFGDGGSWPDGDGANIGCKPFYGIDLGASVGQYTVDTAVIDAAAAAGAAAGAASGATAGSGSGSTAGAASGATAGASAGTTAGTSAGAAAAAAAIAALPPDDDSGLTVVAGAGSSVSLALNTARQPSATRPTRVTVSGTWGWTLTAIGSVTGTVTMQSDASNPPTTARCSASPSKALTLGVAVGLGGTETWALVYDVPAGHYYRIATTGAGTFAITSINETAG